MREVLCAQVKEHPYCCGVFEVGNFYHAGPDDQEEVRLSNHFTTLSYGGTSLFTATFVDSPACRDAYKTLVDKYKLLFQSEPLLNNNSGNRVFLCVFKGRE